ncbi:uncharacterized protein BDR25DRAFT_358259 [Lindgomyces ingoldianus]|uniref:Uncharacterized protein n=1 Tax=Lindgomyces ingoldianus TaxID=673940 RepID=A0ACB6QMB0_9PLEO|nr:uncharacterized protein BDR25DRAFT_358259 [Lindgomyces ingoldianus]KAF2468002.1 hypothetical protein BDR25DRAFT_358259 [Lindgomyces ingoldianus]
MLNSVLLILSVCRHSPSIASQILIVRSSDADASHMDRREKSTDRTGPLWPLSIHFTNHGNGIYVSHGIPSMLCPERSHRVHFAGTILDSTQPSIIEFSAVRQTSPFTAVAEHIFSRSKNLAGEDHEFRFLSAIRALAFVPVKERVAKCLDVDFGRDYSESKIVADSLDVPESATAMMIAEERRTIGTHSVPEAPEGREQSITITVLMGVDSPEACPIGRITVRLGEFEARFVPYDDVIDQLYRGRFRSLPGNTKALGPGNALPASGRLRKIVPGKLAIEASHLYDLSNMTFLLFPTQQDTRYFLV